MKFDPKMWGTIGIIALFLITGSINTLAAKWANTISAVGNDGKEMLFRHSFLQAWGMFLGESLCMVVFLIYKLCYRRKLSYSVNHTIDEPAADEGVKFNPLWLFPPAMIDLVTTSMMYVGLTMTSASSYQMLRGSVIVFTAALSYIVLGHRTGWVRGVGILLVILGLVTVGLTDEFFFEKNPVKVDESSELLVGVPAEDSQPGITNMVLGDIIIICAQFLVAFQVVYEEKFIHRFQMMPLEVVGWEGIFGVTVMSLLLIPFYYIPVGKAFGQNPRGVLEDALHGFTQIWNSSLLAVAFFLGVVSIAFFNFAGITITKDLSATSRKVLDTVRTVIIWSFSLGVKWQEFAWPHLIGFFLLILGMFVYNRIIVEPSILYLNDQFSTRKIIPNRTDRGDFAAEEITINKCQK